jgi:3-oxoacyl-[acyl-carrier protein] reductase
MTERNAHSHCPVVLLSGGSRGLGLAISEKLLDLGYQIVTFSRTETREAKVLAEQYPERLHFRVADMEDNRALGRVVDEAEREIGPIATLINNAAIAIDGLLAIMPEPHIAKMLAVNLEGTLYLTRACVRRMLPRRSGLIINISSIIGQRGYSGLAVYSATKGALDAMTRSLARELGERNIRVNAIAPGYLETEMSHGLSDSQRQQIVRRTPLGRLGKTSDIVGAVSFLMSPDASFITGHTLTIDGGITC